MRRIEDEAVAVNVSGVREGSVAGGPGFPSRIWILLKKS